MWPFARAASEKAPSLSQALRHQSILSEVEVKRSIASGAPHTPWPLRREDRDAMDALASYFEKAIPVPTPEGRVSISETAGHGGPQLELYVPVLSSRNPVAILARDWHPEGSGLETSLFFFGATDGRLAAMVARLGFVPRTDRNETGVTIFRSETGKFKKRAS